jgi:HSP20 family molecular chaperone IbpA
MTNASYAAARCWPVARIVETPDEFRATVDAESFDETDIDVELVERTVRLTGRGIEEGAPRFELRFDLPPDADLDRVRVLSERGRLLITAPYRTPRHRKLEIERADQLVHGDATPV